MSGLCCTCLSQDRVVKPLNMVQFRSLFGDKKDDAACFQVDTKVNTVCWECSALFRKLYNFKIQVFHAQQCLENISRETHTYIQPLTRLSNSTTNFTSACEDDIDSPDCKFNIDISIIRNNENVLQVDTIKSEKLETSETDSADEDNFFDNTPLKNSVQAFEIKCPEIKEENSDEMVHRRTTRSATEARKRKKSINSGKVKKKIKNAEIECKKSPKEKKKVDKVVYENYKILFMGDDELQAKRERDRQSNKFRNRCKYKCESCIFGFVTKEKYERHMTLRHSEEAGKHECVVCGTRFARETSLRQHAAAHHRKYLCVCGFVGYDLPEMAQHDVTEHDKPWFMCTVCLKRFPTHGTLKYHRTNAHATFKCDTCGKVFKAKSSLASHMELIHGPNSLKQCGVCGVKRRHLASHMRKHQAKPEGAYCAECDIRFASMPIYKNHLKYAAAHNPAESLKRSCTYCDFKTVNLNTLRKHITVKHLKEERPFKCHSCDKGFYAECRLRAHVLLKHEGVEKPKDKICHVCGRGFTTKAMLSNHIRVHTGEKPFRCEVCDAAFSQRSSLATHTRGVHLKLKSRPAPPV